MIQIDEKNEVDRKVKKKHKATFQKNINLLIDFIDEISTYDLEDIHECSLLKGEVSEEQLKELYSHIPKDDDFDMSYKIKLVAELWLERELNVSKTQIINWENGKDFPSDENFRNLKQLVRKTSKCAF